MDILDLEHMGKLGPLRTMPCKSMDFPQKDYAVISCLNTFNKSTKSYTRWWFQIFFMFTPIWGNDPILTFIFFKGGGSTTNQL